MNFDVMMSFFVLGKHAEYNLHSAGSLNKQSAGGHVVPFGHYYQVCGNHYTVNVFFFIWIYLLRFKSYKKEKLQYQTYVKEQ